MILKELSIFKQFSDNEELIVLDIETKGNKYYLGEVDLLGIGFYFPSKDVSCYIPNKVFEDGVLHPVKLEDGLRDYVLEIIQTRKIICHNSNFDLGYFSYNLKKDIVPYWDTRIAWHLISPELYKESSGYSLDHAVKYVLQKDSHKQEMYNYLEEIGAKGSGENIYKASLDKVAAYCEDDCRTTYELYEFQRPIIEKFEAYKFMQGVLNYQTILWKQQWTGIKFDTARAIKYLEVLNRATSICIKSLKEMCAPEIRKIEYALTLKKAKSYKREQTREALLQDEDRWIRFNFRSRHHIPLLAEELGVHITEQTETGRVKTSNEVLNKYISANPAINLLVKHSELETKKKFVEQYLAVIHNGRFYPDVDVCGTASGRLTAFKPNILAINRRDKRFMRCFVADEGYKFIQWDLSNIEPRIEAHFAQDDDLANIVMTGKDIYLELLKHIYPDKVHLYDPKDLKGSKERLKTERDMLKQIRLALGYGMGVQKLAATLEIDTHEAKRIYNAYWTARKCSKNLENRLLIQYKNKGFIKNMWGRPLTMAYTKDLLNRYISSSSHDLLIVINIELFKILNDLGLDYKPALMDVHDEHICNIKEEHIDKYLSSLHIILKELNESLKLLAPIALSYKIVNNFMEIK